MWLLALLACTTPIPRSAVLEAAEDLSAIGHPHARFEDADIAGSSSGLFGGDQWVDLNVHYRKGDERHTMKVRIQVNSTDPCEVRTHVLDDTGPMPILLDNGIASQAVGEALCEAWADGP